MALSEYEQRVLEQMERQLLSDDPKLATTMTEKRTRSFQQYLIASAGATVGVGVLIAGAFTQAAWLGIIGFLILFAAILYVVSAKPAGALRTTTTGGKGSAPKPRQSLQDRIAERWEKRQRPND